MSVLTLNVDEAMRTLSAKSANPFVTHDKEVDIVRFAINSGFADIVLDGQVALRVMYQRPGESQVRAQTLTYYDTDGLHNYYDWQLSQSDLAKNGSLMVALCILDISGGEVSEWHTTPCAVKVLSTIHTDGSDEGDETITPTVAERVAVLESMIQRVASGAPIVVSSISAMTDTSQIYVLSTDGNWYYYDGSAWVAGGEYGTVATDKTLTQENVPADAKAVGDKISKIKSDLSELQDGGYIADAQKIQEKIDKYLDEHPEATTTVKDGAITWPKLNSTVQTEISDKAPAIREAGEKAYTHATTGQTEIEVYGNTFENETVKLYDKAQFAFSNDNYISRNYGVSFTPNGRCYKANGTATSYYSNVWLMSKATAADIPEELKGKTVRMRVLTDKAVTMPYKDGTTTSTIFDLYVDDVLVLRLPTGGIENSVLDVSGTVEIPANASKWRVLWTILTAGSVFDNVNFLFMFYDNNVSIYDSGMTVNADSSVLVSIPQGYDIVDSGAHQSAIYSVVDTKEYIDGHVPEDAVVITDLPYVTPEMFGAVGDDVTDDSQALADCITYAIENGKSIVGGGIYLIHTPIDIDGDGLSIDINGIHYSSADPNGYALKLQTSYSRINIRRIHSSRDALIISATSDTTSLRNEIRIVNVASTYTAIKLTTDGAGIHYNAFYVENLYSSDGDLITGDNVDAIQENYFYNAYCGCRKGWAIKDCPGRYYNFSFEAACKNAIYMINGGLYTFIGCRYGEMVNKKLYEIAGYNGASLEDDEGTLIKIVRGNCIFIGDRVIPYACFDVSDMPTYSDTPITNTWKEGTLWGCMRIIAPIANGTSYLIKNGYSHLGKEMFIQAGRKICVPKYQSTYTITEADFDMRDAQGLLNNAKPYPTKMVIGVANCVIHLSDSYCSMGYNSVIVDQSDATKLCTIYDSRDANTPIFNGVTLGAGVYKLTCYCDCANTDYTDPAYVTNTTENDVWSIEKIS